MIKFILTNNYICNEIEFMLKNIDILLFLYKLYMDNKNRGALIKSIS